MPFEQLVSRKATVHDTVMLIVKTINEYASSEFVQRITAALQPGTGTREDFLKRVFWYACYNARYTMDPEGHEMIFTPERAMREGQSRGIDCKKFTTLIAAILKAAGIDPLLKVISYDGQRWEHIYVIVLRPGGSYWTLDPVNHCKWNSEIPHNSGWIYFLNGTSMPDTKLSLLGKMNGGTIGNYTGGRSFNLKSSIHLGACSLMDQMGCMGAEPNLQQLEQIYADLFSTSLPTTVNTVSITRSQTVPMSLGRKTAAQRKERRQRLLQKFKNVGLALPRVAFLTILRMNVGGIANKLARGWTKDPDKVKGLWMKIGGDPEELRKSILGGSVIPPPAPRQSGLNGLGVAITASAIATATPIIIAVQKLLSDLKANAPEGSTEEEQQQEEEKFDEEVVDPGECDADGGFIDADLKSAAYSGNRPGATDAIKKYDPEALLKYYKDNNIDLNKVKIPGCDPEDTNGGGGGGGSPTAGSFATSTINTWSDLLNFFKGAGAINMGAQIHDVGLLAAIGTAAALLYALRKKLQLTRIFITSK